MNNLSKNYSEGWKNSKKLELELSKLLNDLAEGTISENKLSKVKLVKMLGVLARQQEEMINRNISFQSKIKRELLRLATEV